MQVTVTNTSGLERRIEITLPSTRVAGEVERRLRDYSRTARIKGFRPGKVPFNVIKQQFGGQARGEVVNDLIRSSYGEALSKNQLRPVGDPRIEPIALDEGGDLQFAALIEVFPQFTLAPLESLTVERQVVDITEADVDAMIESMRKQRTDYREVSRPAQAGDRVTVDFLGKRDGTPFDGGAGTDTPFVLGAGRAIADFETALTGMSAGESKTAPVTFPENYGAKELAGQQTEFDLTCKKVEEPVLPEVNDEFAKAFGIEEGGVERLREEVRKSMEREAAEAIRTRVRNVVFDALQAANPVELPRALVNDQIQSLQLEMMQRMGARDANQIPPREPFEEPARRRVALGLLLGEVINTQGLKLDRERVAERLEELCSAYPNPEEVRRSYLSNPDALRQLEAAVLEDQAVDFVLSKAQVTDMPQSFTEVTGFGRQG
ncbi:MAG: hypothetical protein RL026_1185 [Pseudomonadota bacterium]|jgi:trigger factor